MCNSFCFRWYLKVLISKIEVVKNQKVIEKLSQIMIFASRDHEIIDRSYLCQSHPWIFQGCTDLHKCSLASVFCVLATIAMTAVTSKGGWKKLTKLLCTTATTFPFCDCTCERHPPPLHLAINCVVFDTDIKARLVLPTSRVHTYMQIADTERVVGVSPFHSYLAGNIIFCLF